MMISYPYVYHHVYVGELQAERDLAIPLLFDFASLIPLRGNR